MVCRAKKKVVQEGDGSDGIIIDPLEDLDISVQSYDINHEAYIYFDQAGNRVWTKGYFNNKKKGEPSVEVTRQMAIKFIHGEISQEVWLSRYYPKQMTAYKKAIQAAKKQFIGY